MKIYVIIPAHNEEALITQTLDSLVHQTQPPEKVVVVDDNSTDATAQKVRSYQRQYPWIDLVSTRGSTEHLPGSKVIQAFQKGFETVDFSYDIIAKMDADLIFPTHYFETIRTHFQSDATIGMVGGFCYIKKNREWVLENLTNKDHIRGALKAYRKECFEAIGGLKPSMGWDTVDELLAQYHGWKIKTDETLHVKHLKPTGNTYNPKARYKQGEAFYKLRYGFILTTIASIKLALRKSKPGLTKDYLLGYLRAKKTRIQPLVTPEEGKFIRKLRWQKIRQKFG